MNNDIEELKIVSIVNFVRGGKSSISRLLAEELKTTILNFDPNRNSKFYNAVKTINIEADSSITKNKDSLTIDTEDSVFQIKSKSNFLLCDFGGRFDKRINEFKSDIYILPMMDDFESISETIRATKYVLSNNPKAKIIHVLNMAQCFDKADKENFRAGYLENIASKKIEGITTLEMPRSKLIKTLVNSGVMSSEVTDINDKVINYRNVDKFTNSLIELIKMEINKC